MGLFKGALTARRYRVLGDVPESFRVTYPGALRANAFSHPASLIRGEELVGWSDVHNLLDVAFEGDGWLYNQYVVLGVRAERKCLPPKLFKAELAARVRAWCQEHHRERAPASVRTEIKELLEDEMFARQTPRVAHYEFVWNLVEGWAVLAHGSATLDEVVRKLFRKTFGLDLHAAGPAEFLVDNEAAWGALEVASSIQVSAEDAKARGRQPQPELTAMVSGNPFTVTKSTIAQPSMVSDWLLWLWWRSDVCGGRLQMPEDGATVDVWVDDKVVTRTEATGTRSALQGENIAGCTTAHAALADGQIVSELRIGIRRDGREYSLSLKGAELLAVSLKLPAECRGESDEVLYERMFLYEDVVYVLGALWRSYAAERIQSKVWVSDTLPAIAAWVFAGANPDSGDADQDQEAVEQPNQAALQQVQVAEVPLPDGTYEVQLRGSGAGTRAHRLGSAQVAGGRIVDTTFRLEGGGAPGKAGKGAQATAATTDEPWPLPPPLERLIKACKSLLRQDVLSQDGVQFVDDVRANAENMARGLRTEADWSIDAQLAVRNWTAAVQNWERSPGGDA